MEKINDPVYMLIEDNPEITDILFRKKNSRWEFNAPGLGQAGNLFLNDFFYSHTFPYLQKKIPDELVSVHYFREESGELVRALIGKANFS